MTIPDLSLQNRELPADEAVGFYIDAAAEQLSLDQEISEILESIGFRFADLVQSHPGVDDYVLRGP